MDAQCTEEETKEDVIITMLKNIVILNCTGSHSISPPTTRIPLTIHLVRTNARFPKIAVVPIPLISALFRVMISIVIGSTSWKGNHKSIFRSHQCDDNQHEVKHVAYA